jgi:fatty acid desaturase
MRPYVTNTDPRHKNQDKQSAFKQFFLEKINDERDYPFIQLLFKITFTVIPVSVLLFVVESPNWLWWVLALTHIILVNFVFLSPFTLMLHNTSHRRFFKVKYQWGNYIIPWIVGPFIGQSPELYHSHHIGMHHAEGNMPDDESSTMPYQRDSILGFLVYFSRFFFQAWITLMLYFKRKNRTDLIPKTLYGELSFIIMAIGLSFVNFPATFIVFIGPFVVIRFGMVAGNWGQHAFVDHSDPNNPYLNSVTCINCSYNHKCFNDGYHIGHHVKPHLHWTEMPVDFDKNIHKYAENKSLVFEKLNHFTVWGCLMLNRYDWLAKYAVNINNTFSSDEEIINLMKKRVRIFKTV